MVVLRYWEDRSWTADTLRPDGLRVVISAFNSGARHEDATRDAPR
ncbi:hypothetical protein GCM10009601_16050 [Streptomyces thermospinosisporus]|uniref:Uncharacterized protein n=1 Tax=Streptomyces thermospinosisporus TaxID=161482 RepID=A0ABP4JII9_9ACTN